MDTLTQCEIKQKVECGTQSLKRPSRIQNLEAEKSDLIKRLGRLQEMIDILRNDEYFTEKLERFDKLNSHY